MAILFTPKNDAELNALIAQSKSALAKYFHLTPSDRRSEKLRDFICESLGFTHGGYQQLQAVWANASAASAVPAYSFDGMAWRVSLEGSQYRCDGFFSGEVADSLAVLNRVAACLGNEAQDATLSVLITGVVNDPSTVINEAYHPCPIWLHDTVVGYAASPENAATLGGLLQAAHTDFRADFKGSVQKRSSAPYVLLRASSQDSGLHIAFTSLSVVNTFNNRGELVEQGLLLQTERYGEIKIAFIPSSRCYRFNGIDFDFAIAYFDGADQQGLVALPDGTQVHSRRCEFDGEYVTVSKATQVEDDEVYVTFNPTKHHMTMHVAVGVSAS